MKKAITHFMILSTFVLLGTTVFGQCTGSVDIKNSSGDNWTVSYYNNNILVPAGTSVTLGFVNANPTIGRGVILGSPSTTVGCAHKFQNNPDIWNPTCAPATTQVTYTGVLDPATGCYNAGLILIQ